MAVDNTRLADGVPTLNTDWWNYGGITRDVSLVDVPERFIRPIRFAPSIARVRRSRGWVHVEGAMQGEAVTVAIPEARLSVTASLDAKGNATVTLPAAGLEFWSPEHPKLYG